MTVERKGENRRRATTIALTIVALLLPALSLIPLGSIWLWQHGYVLVWALCMLAIVSVAFILLRRQLLPLLAPVESALPEDVPKAIWNQRQEQAWSDVLAFSRTVDPKRVGSRDAMMALGLETVSRVAGRMHPEHRDPLLRFTVPEALAVIEQTCDGLRAYVETNLPFGDRMTVAQIMWVYRWRSVLPLVEKGYDLWRVVRLINPISAATQELRERYTRQIYEMGREHIARRLVQEFVKEVGKAAIDLYGGSLRVRRERLAEHVSEATLRDTAMLDRVAAEPIRILVAGQNGAGKSSLINILTKATDAAVDILPATHQQMAYRLVRDGLPEALLVDTPGLNGDVALAGLMLAATDCDMLLWVSNATQAARADDRAAIDALRAAFARGERSMPPLLVALTHIDALRPFGEWAPPYDVNEPTTAKGKAIRGAMDAVARELAVATAQILPVRADAEASSYNIDALWASIAAALPDAKKSRLQRCLEGASKAWTWTGVLSQATNAGRIVSRGLLSRS